MSENESEIIKKLDMLIKLAALNALKGREFRDQVKVLYNIGFRPKEIAELLGKTPNNIRVTLSLIKKGGG